MAKIGRPSKLEPKVLEKILAAARSFTSRRGCAAAGGIGYSTLKTWLRKGGAQKKGEYRDFRTRFLKAEDEAEVVGNALILRAARDPKHWKAAAWLLERRRERHYGKRVKLQGDKDNPIEHNAVFTLETPPPPGTDPRPEDSD